MPPRNDAGDLSSFGTQAKSTLSPSRNAALITDCRWCESAARYIRVYFTQPVSSYFVSHGARGGRAEGERIKCCCRLPESHVFNAVAFIAQLGICNNEKGTESRKLWEVLEGFQFGCQGC